MKTDDLSKTFVSIPLKGDDDDSILKNYQAVEPDLQQINGGRIQLAGLEPLASELTGTIGEDQQRAEVAAIPLVWSCCSSCSAASSRRPCPASSAV